MSQRIEDEKKWLTTIVIPHMLRTTGSLDKFSKNSDLKRSSVDNDLRIKSIEIKFIDIDEAFMLTICYRATIEYELKGQTDKTKLVVKKTPDLSEKLYDEVNFSALFNNELLAYEKIKPAIEEFTKQPLKVPRNIYNDLQRHSASIVLEDFGVNGWRVAKERYNLSLEHALTTVKFLGDFHGIGFAMREVKPKEFNEIVGELREPRYDNKLPDDWQLSIKQSLERLINATRQYEPAIEEEFLEKLQQILRDARAYGKKCITPKEPFVTLCHGDFLRNNIAFRYTVQQGVEIPIEAMMFDLQTMRVTSPMLDMSVFLMLSVFADVRHKNFQLIFESYRESLIRSFEAHAKKKAPAFFSYDSLLKEYIRIMPYGTHIASFFLMNLVEPPDGGVEKFLTDRGTPEEMIENLKIRGGAIVDRELSYQVRELRDLSKKYDVDISV